jgi:hypothetical protein
MKKILFLLLLAFLCWNASAQRGGELEVTTSNKYAVVIGNANYTFFGRLTNPINDADDMRDALSNLGYTVFYLRDANLAQMKDAVLNMQRRLTASSNAFGVFYFSGHGAQSNGQDYLIPANANIPNRDMLPDLALPLEYVSNALRNANNVLNVVILDACRDLPWRGGVRGIGNADHYPAGSIIAYATEPGKTSDDAPNERNGRFTGQLLQNIRTRGLEIHELFRRTGAGVIQKTNNMQIPVTVNLFHGIASLDGTRPNNIPDTQPYNPFVGSWSAEISTNSGKYKEKLICDLSFWPNGTITVGRYDTNTMIYKTVVWLYYWYGNDIRHGHGNGTYAIREDRNSYFVDIKLNISGVLYDFYEIRAVGKLDKNNPNRFTADSMKCEYKDGKVSDAYYTFTKNTKM